MIIPKITDALGSSWKQPNLAGIEIDDTHVLMSERSLSELREYSMSIPSAVYEGKMWKCKYRSGWLLRWYSNSKDKKDHCDINQRIILTL